VAETASSRSHQEAAVAGEPDRTTAAQDRRRRESKYSRHRSTAARTRPSSNAVGHGLAILIDIRCRRYVRNSISRTGAAGRVEMWRGGSKFVSHQGPFIRAARESAAPERELVIGQWSLIPGSPRGACTAGAPGEDRCPLAHRAASPAPGTDRRGCIVLALASAASDLAKQ